MTPTLAQFWLSFTWPIILCLVIGIGLLVFEMFTPGFGVAGAFGIILLVAAVMLMSGSPLYSLWLAMILLVVVSVFLLVFVRSAQKGRISRSRLVLKDELTTKEGFVSVRQNADYLGQKGKTLTMLRPAGTVSIDGVRLDVVTDGEFIPAGADVVVDRVEGIRVIVKLTED